MKITGLVFIFYTVLNSINIVDSQPTISYKESNNMSLPKEYINDHNPPRPPAPISTTIHSFIPSPIPTHLHPCCNYPPPSPQIINIPSSAPGAPATESPASGAPASGAPAPINSIYVTPTCQNMF